jgi:hypothetical protein
MADKRGQDLKELAELSEIFAEAAYDRMAAQPDILDAVDLALSAEEGNDLARLELEIVSEHAAAQVDDILGETGKTAEERAAYLEAANARLAGKIVALAELYARVMVQAEGLAATTGLMPIEARTPAISGKFARHGAPTLARLAAIPPSPPAFRR